eukprot:2993722-Pyramimonas_sp.AAC.1
MSSGSVPKTARSRIPRSSAPCVIIYLRALIFHAWSGAYRGRARMRTRLSSRTCTKRGLHERRMVIYAGGISPRKHSPASAGWARSVATAASAWP